MSLCH
jgi:hypothetical protein